VRTSNNPLLAGGFRLPFHRIEVRHIEPGIKEALAQAQAEIDAVAADPAPPSWANTMEAIERTVEVLAERLAPVTHLVTVAETRPLREAYNAVLPEITAFWSRLPLNAALWKRIKAYSDSQEAAGLSGIRRRHLEKTMREFRHAGADLAAPAKARLEEVRIELARLQQSFSENVLDATAAYERLVTEEERLAGVPAAAKRRAREKAEAKGKKGWLLTLDYPAVEPILKHCHDRALRREIHLAYATRCRDGEFDNRALLARILRLRDELAQILGYESFPDYALEDRMAGSGARAAAFEADLVERTRPYWERDVAQLRAHATELGVPDLEPWDASYVMEELRRKRYDIDDETLRPYFPLPHVLAGLFEIVRRTFGFRIEEREIDELWHEDVRYFELFDETDGAMVGAFYSDWFPRPEKRQGAWMNHFITGGPRADGFAPHLGVICGNFTPPDGDGPALLTHREVETTFHEFGHLLHHCTSRVPVPSRAGINVAWDWVELPSQLMENWTWEREALDVFAAHHESGERLPEEVYQRMVAARRYMGGWAQMRQLSLGTVDLALHGELAPRLRGEAATASSELDGKQGDAVMEFGEERFTPFAAQPRFAELHMLTSFTHLFAGGYAAAYYSYLWSEVLDADVFTRFRREGIFNRETGRSYVDAILSRGDSADPDQLFLEFMGRPPDPSALLERNLGPLADD
jgi:oligopeptidase A